MDPWALLGVAPGSSDRAIRAAYLRRSKELHPDLGGTDEAMRDLNVAYQAVLAGLGPSSASSSAPPPPSAGSSAGSSAGPVPPRQPRPAPFVAPPVRRPRKRFYKRPILYVMVGVTVAFLATSGATNPPSPSTRPAVYGLIGRCVNLANREIEQVVPCVGPHDAWVVAVVDRQELCPALATGYVATISHHICFTTER